jgi:hypothetical protein
MYPIGSQGPVNFHTPVEGLYVGGLKEVPQSFGLGFRKLGSYKAYPGAWRNGN